MKDNGGPGLVSILIWIVFIWMAITDDSPWQAFYYMIATIPVFGFVYLFGMDCIRTGPYYRKYGSKGMNDDSLVVWRCKWHFLCLFFSTFFVYAYSTALIFCHGNFINAFKFILNIIGLFDAENVSYYYFE